jgi:signal transduction histidine kinase
MRPFASARNHFITGRCHPEVARITGKRAACTGNHDSRHSAQCRASLDATKGMCYDWSMKHAPIEPGLLSIFRLVNGIWLAIYGPRLLSEAFDPAETFTPLVCISTLSAIILLLYLYSGWLRHRMGRLYLPLALLVASVGAVLAQRLDVAWRIHHDMPPELVVVDEGYLFGILFVPVIIVSAQYNFKTALAFILSVAGMQTALAHLLVPAGSAPMKTIMDETTGQVVIFPVVAFLVVRVVGGQKIEREALTEKNTKLTRYATTVERLAVSHERNRLARELHDTLAHTLSGVAVQLEALNKQLDHDPDGAKRTVLQLRDSTRDGLQEARRALQALRASPLEDLGLVLAMRQIVDSVTDRSGLCITLDMPSELDGLPPEVEQGIYRITEEALNNTVRHANAQCVAVALLREPGGLRLTITDNGFGFDPATVSLNGHYGLVGMRERALLCNGHLDIASAPATGTTVCLTVEV